jgi:excinuclease ABC subunit C
MTTGEFDARSFVRELPRRPGVYRMYDATGTILYVGKAASLRDRVGSYFGPRALAAKVHALVRQVARLEVTVTNSETEALLLEYNLIKAHRPRYNVILRDDKSFPYIHLDESHPFPRFAFYRGSRGRPGRYFGPYPGAGAVRATLAELHRLFRVRNCRDTFFANRSRPCLQHQIGRCTAPCVGLISREDYARDVAACVKVLEGRSREVDADLTSEMEAAAARLEFERAAELRDRLAALKIVQAQQDVTGEEPRDADVFAITGEPGEYAISLLMIRGGRSLGTTNAFPRATLAEPAEALGSFLVQHYAEGGAPREVFVHETLADAGAIAEVLASRSGHAVDVRRPARGVAARWTAMAAENAAHALRLRRAQHEGIEAQRASLAASLDLPAPPERIECFDISHTSGEGTVASCVVFGPEGALRGEYRRFNIAGIVPGDDFGALGQAVTRRYTRIREGEIAAPDLLLVDGGTGQTAVVHEALAALGFAAIPLVGVSKGPDRRPGQERLHVHGEPAPRSLDAGSPALRLVQRIRDEAHRFAITGHRRRRARRYSESVLETVPGLGPAKRRALLSHFGGLQGILRAGVVDLERVQGIGTVLAQSLYDHLHPGG